MYFKFATLLLKPDAKLCFSLFHRNWGSGDRPPGLYLRQLSRIWDKFLHHIDKLEVIRVPSNKTVVNIKGENMCKVF